jgi:hypothetical protein
MKPGTFAVMMGQPVRRLKTYFFVKLEWNNFFLLCCFGIDNPPTNVGPSGDPPQDLFIHGQVFPGNLLGRNELKTPAHLPQFVIIPVWGFTEAQLVEQPPRISSIEF